MVVALKVGLEEAVQISEVIIVSPNLAIYMLTPTKENVFAFTDVHFVLSLRVLLSTVGVLSYNTENGGGENGRHYQHSVK